MTKLTKKPESEHSLPDTAGLDRREFLAIAGGGLTVLFTAGALPSGIGGQRSGREYPEDFNAYLRIGEDGRVSLFTGKIEMGQGIVTSLAQMLAEELDVPLGNVDMVMGDTRLCPWDMGTFGSRSTKYFGPPLRQAAAEARAVLLELAATRLKADPGDLKVSDGTILVPGKPETSVSFSQLVGGRRILRKVDPKPSIKPRASHTVSGKSTDRTDARAKVTGEAKFTGDIRVPGMLYASILRPPAHGAVLKSVDTSAAREAAGILVVEEKDIIAVLHERPDAAEAALSLIKSEYTLPPPLPDNATIFDYLRRNAPPGEIVTEKGRLETGRAAAARNFSGTYFNHYVAHAPMEPHTALVRPEGEEATVWASTQTPFRAPADAARGLNIPEERVRAITPFVGGGFGGKTRNQQVEEAARLARYTKRPVQVAWTRKEEFMYDTFRPAAVIDIRSGLDNRGRICFWDLDIFFAGTRSSQPFYAIPHFRVLSRGNWGGEGGVHPFRVGAWRGPGSNTNTFAIESQIDIMAAAAGTDPLEFRLRNLENPRMARVLNAAADAFGHTFAPGPSGKGFGLACTDYLGTYVAAAAEVEADRTSGNIRVKRVVCAQDTGEIINPEGIRMQIEGCVTMGLGYILSEEIRFQGGRVLDENFDSYEIPRFSWLPKIETVLVDNPDMPPQGCGEPAITVMGALIANAVHDALGVRIFTLPMTPDRVKAAPAVPEDQES